MQKKYEEYKARIISTDDFKPVIEEARTDFGITASGSPIAYNLIEIPLNLEREYFDRLLDDGRITEARMVLERMMASYRDIELQNLIESWSYRLGLIDRTNKLVAEKLQEAKKEFNHHTIIIISIVVGTITIFGSANEIFHANSMYEAILTFFTISLAVIALAAVALFANRQ